MDHDVSTFDCGKEPLNRWLREMAWQKQKYHTTRTFVSLRGRNVVGYFSLVFGAVGRESMPRKVSRGVAKEHQIPILLIARLGVCRSAQGQGLGPLLLREAVRKTAIGASVGGLCALLVDAMDGEARMFYLKYGFHPSSLDDMQLFLTTGEVLDSVQGEDAPDSARTLEEAAPAPPPADITTLCTKLDQLRAEGSAAEEAGDSQRFGQAVAQQVQIRQKLDLLCEADDLARELTHTGSHPLGHGGSGHRRSRGDSCHPARCTYGFAPT